MAKKAFFLLALCAFVAYSAVYFPYPQKRNYGNGTINTTVEDASDRLKAKFTSFLSTHYEEQGQLARIKFDGNKDTTVSEGIAYGMMMMVYFSDNTTSYQGHFDKLWAYYNRFLNGNGLMIWKIIGFSNAGRDQGAATDSEFDAALALVMAHYQFGDQKYLNDARTLIGKIRQHEMEPNGLHKPGDTWNDRKNPSYVSPAAFEIFKDLDQASFWQTAITANYTLLRNNQNKSSVGLPSDWCDASGNHITRNNWDRYSYDASRAPWRWAWANAWYGHQDAKTLLSNLAPWVNNQTATDVKGPILPNGNMSGDKNSTFIGPFVNVLSYSSTYQNKMNEYWNALMARTDASYFNKAMQIITGLLATGNMPNLKALTSPVLNTNQTHGNNVFFKNSNLHLELTGNTVLQVFDLRGNEVFSSNLTKGSHTVSLSALPKGLYIAKASFGSERRILRVPVN